MKTYCIALSLVSLTMLMGQNQGGTFIKMTSETLRDVPTTTHRFDQPTRLRPNMAVFTGSAPDTGTEVWIIDGKSQGVTLLRDINPGPNSSNAQGFIRYDDEVFFYADDGVHGMEVWRTDGTERGTRMVADLVPGAGGMKPTGMIVVDQRLYMPVDSGAGGTLTLHVLTKPIPKRVTQSGADEDD